MIIILLSVTFLFWLMFLPAGKLLTMKEQGKIDTPLKKTLYTLYAIIFIPADVLFNYTIADIFFLEIPPDDRFTFTMRLTYYLRNEPDSWRGKFAYFICCWLIEPHHFGHCGLGEK